MKIGINDISWLENRNKVHPVLVMLVSHKKKQSNHQVGSFFLPSWPQAFFSLSGDSRERVYIPLLRLEIFTMSEYHQGLYIHLQKTLSLPLSTSLNASDLRRRTS